MSEPGAVTERLTRIRADLARAACEAGRQDEVALVVVTKTVPNDEILEAYAAGQRLFGENRVQEAVAKIGQLKVAMPDARWHLIGHLQTNKTRVAAENFATIESVDTVRLARKLDAAAGRLHRQLPVFLEVNAAGETTKSGFSASGLVQAIPDLLTCPSLELCGLMTVAPLVTNPDDVAGVFRSMRELRDDIRLRFDLPSLLHLSMGMSGDYQVAVREGATIVRIGRAIFGERPITERGPG